MAGTDHIHPIFDQFGRQRNFDFCAEVEPSKTWPYMFWIQPSTQQVRVRNQDNTDWIALSGGGAGAPVDAQYLVLALNAGLSAERRLVAGDGLALNDGGANGDATLNVDATIVRTTGAQAIAGIKTFSDNIVLDDGAGDSPQLQFIGGSNDDTATIFLDDDAAAGMSDLIVRLVGTTGNAQLIVENSAGTDIFRVFGGGGATLDTGQFEVSAGQLVVYRTAGPGGYFSINDGINNAVTEIWQLVHTSAAGGAAGMGGRLTWRLRDGGVTSTAAVWLDAVWDSVSPDDASLRIRVKIAGAGPTEVARFDKNGLLIATGKVVDLDGNADGVIWDADGDTTEYADVDDTLKTKVGGTVYGIRTERVHAWDEVYDVGTWYDHKVKDATDGDHFRIPAGTFPTGWTEVDAAAGTNTTNQFSFWYLYGQFTETSWKYRRQMGMTIGAGAWVSFAWGPILWRDGGYTADLHYYFGMYSDNGAGGINENIYIRCHLWWDSANAVWKIRGEEGDGSAGNEFTNPDHVGAWQTFGFPIHQPIWVRSLVRNVTAQTCRAYIGTAPWPPTHTLLLDQAPTVTNWNTVNGLWLQTHMTRGAGVLDSLYIGAVDLENAS